MTQTGKCIELDSRGLRASEDVFNIVRDVARATKQSIGRCRDYRSRLGTRRLCTRRTSSTKNCRSSLSLDGRFELSRHKERGRVAEPTPGRWPTTSRIVYRVSDRKYWATRTLIRDPRTAHRLLENTTAMQDKRFAFQHGTTLYLWNLTRRAPSKLANLKAALFYRPMFLDDDHIVAYLADGRVTNVSVSERRVVSQWLLPPPRRADGYRPLSVSPFSRRLAFASNRGLLIYPARALQTGETEPHRIPFNRPMTSLHWVKHRTKEWLVGVGELSGLYLFDPDTLRLVRRVWQRAVGAGGLFGTWVVDESTMSLVVSDGADRGIWLVEIPSLRRRPIATTAHVGQYHALIWTSRSRFLSFQQSVWDQLGLPPHGRPQLVTLNGKDGARATIRVGGFDGAGKLNYSPSDRLFYRYLDEEIGFRLYDERGATLSTFGLRRGDPFIYWSDGYYSCRRASCRMMRCTISGRSKPERACRLRFRQAAVLATHAANTAR